MKNIHIIWIFLPSIFLGVLYLVVPDEKVERTIKLPTRQWECTKVISSIENEIVCGQWTKK